MCGIRFIYNTLNAFSRLSCFWIVVFGKPCGRHMLCLAGPTHTGVVNLEPDNVRRYGPRVAFLGLGKAGGQDRRLGDRRGGARCLAGKRFGARRADDRVGVSVAQCLFYMCHRPSRVAWRVCSRIPVARGHRA